MKEREARFLRQLKSGNAASRFFVPRNQLVALGSWFNATNFSYPDNVPLSEFATFLRVIPGSQASSRILGSSNC